MNFIHRMLAVAAGILLCIAVPGRAAEPGPGPLTLQDAIRATLEKNPQLAGYTLRQDALAGEQLTAALKPGFSVATDLENVVGTGQYSGVKSPELTLALSSLIERGGKRDARVGVVSARQQQLASTQRVVTLDVLTALTHQFIGVVAAQEQVTLQQQAVQLAQQTLDSLTARVQAGNTPEAEQLRANAALARAHIGLQGAEQQLRGERIRLSAFWAQTNPEFTAVQADLFGLAPAAPLNDLLVQLETNPDIAVLADAVQLSTAELRQAQTQRDPDVTWSAGVRRLQGTADSAFVVGASLPLGTTQRASGAITTAAANQAFAELQYANVRVQLQAQVMSLYEAHTQALNEVNSLRTDVLPLLEQAMTATAEAFDQGRYSYLELNLAQREILDAQSTLIDAAARAQDIRIEIERLTGSALTGRTLEVTP